MSQANVTSQILITMQIYNNQQFAQMSQVTCHMQWFWFLNTSYNNNIIIIYYYYVIIIDPSPITKAYACDL